jgi:hypothetical protein
MVSGRVAWKKNVSPRMGRSLLNNRILIAAAEKGSASLPKLHFSMD